MLPESVTTLAIIGDMQETSPLEFWRERNDAGRNQLIREVLLDGAPVVVLLGDMVFDGSSLAHWTRFDAVIEPLRHGGRTLIPVIGNHEYWSIPFLGGNRTARLRYFDARFPGCIEPPCRMFRLGKLALVIIDSNVSQFSTFHWEQQKLTYQKCLEDLDTDRTIEGVFVFSHHPPFTNSKLTYDELHVQQDFVPAFLKARKTLAMLSGHVHTYERFLKQGKTFIVSGGGGGPRVERHQGKRKRHEEAFESSDQGAVRPLHYLHCDLEKDGVQIDVRGMGSNTIERFFLSYPK